MAYNQFTLQRVVAEFGLVLNSTPDLFPGVAPFPLPAGLRAVMPRNLRLAASNNTEAARAAFLIAPMLGEVWQTADYRIALFSGTRFDVDEASGLTGVCDFMFGRPPQLHYVVAPVMMIAEAKNDDIPGGMGQCAAAMVAALRFNAGKNPDITTVHGAVSDGERWRFLRLHENTLEIEIGDRLIADPDRIFGILLHIVGVTPAAPAAA